MTDAAAPPDQPQDGIAPSALPPGGSPLPAGVAPPAPAPADPAPLGADVPAAGTSGDPGVDQVSDQAAAEPQRPYPLLVPHDRGDDALAFAQIAARAGHPNQVANGGKLPEYDQELQAIAAQVQRSIDHTPAIPGSADDSTWAALVAAVEDPNHA